MPRDGRQFIRDGQPNFVKGKVMSASPDGSLQLARIEQQIDSLQSAINRLKHLRVFFFVAMIAIVVGVVYLFSQLAKQVTSERYLNEITALAQKNLESNHSAYQKELQAFVDHAYPVIAGEITAQATRDLQKYTNALEKERDTLMKNLEGRMNTMLADKYKQVLNQHEAAIVNKFPELQNQEVRTKVLANLQLLVDGLVARNYGDKFHDSFQKVLLVWDTFPASNEPTANEPKLEEKLLENLMVLSGSVMTTMQHAEKPTTIAARPAANITPTQPAADAPAAQSAQDAVTEPVKEKSEPPTDPKP
jgi:hypothetical protein